MRKIAAAAGIALALAAASFAPAAFAEVKSSAPDALIIEYRADVAMAKDALWARLVKPAAWWSSVHTYSGSAANMSLKLAAGGCWCEIWKGGAVEHGHVVAMKSAELLRLETALGPLQELAVKGALTFELAQSKTPGHVALAMTYRVVGSSQSRLDALAAVVDTVLGQQFATLTKVD